MSDERDSRGVFLVRGGWMDMPALTVELASDGKLVAEGFTFHLSREVTSTWLRAALDRLGEAHAVQADLVAASDTEDTPRLVAALEADLAASLQAIVAAGAALDSFHLSTRDRLGLPPELLETWRKNRRSARAKQITEVLRRASGLNSAETKRLKRWAMELMTWRGRAVHPAGESRNVVYHPVIGRHVDWRFGAFRCEMAEALVKASLGIIAQLVRRPSLKNQRVRKLFASVREATDPLLERWEAQRGELFKRSPGEARRPLTGLGPRGLNFSREV